MTEAGHELKSLPGINVKLSQEVYDFLRNNFNLMMRADGSSVIHAEIHLEIDPEGGIYMVHPSPYAGTSMLASYIQDTTGENGKFSAFLYEENVVDRKVGEGFYRPKEEE